MRLCWPPLCWVNSTRWGTKRQTRRGQLQWINWMNKRCVQHSKSKQPWLSLLRGVLGVRTRETKRREVTIKVERRQRNVSMRARRGKIITPVFGGFLLKGDSQTLQTFSELCLTFLSPSFSSVLCSCPSETKWWDAQEVSLFKTTNQYCSSVWDEIQRLHWKTFLSSKA